MRKKNSAVLFIVLVLTIAMASISMAASQKNKGWHYGPQWQQDSFSGSGVVKAIDTANLTMTVQLNGTSRLLRDSYGTDYTVVLDADTRFAGLSNGGMGGMMAATGSMMNTIMNGMVNMNAYNGATTGMMNGNTGMMDGNIKGNIANTKAKMGPGQAGYGVEGKLTISDVQLRDNIQFMGYKDPTTGNLIVTWVLVWLY